MKNIYYYLGLIAFLLLLSSFNLAPLASYLVSFFLIILILNLVLLSLGRAFVFTLVILGLVWLFWRRGAMDRYEFFETQKEEKIKDAVMKKANAEREVGEADTFKDAEEDEENDELPKAGDKYMESAKAQKETFRLIDTIKQLEETLAMLSPTLKEGATIIEKFKKLNLN